MISWVLAAVVTTVDEGVSSVLVAAVTTIGTVAAAYLAARSGKGPFRKVEDAAVWKERHDLEEAKRLNLEERLTQERADAAEERRKMQARILECEAATDEERRKREFAERDADAADRRLNAVYAELRQTGQVTDRRTMARDGE